MYISIQWPSIVTEKVSSLFSPSACQRKTKPPQQTTLTLFLKMIKTDCFDYVLCANNTIM